MTIISYRYIKKAFLAGLILLSPQSFGQAYKDALDRAELKLLEVHRIEAEIDVMEREVATYDKSIRENERTQEKMKDKADRLKYKVMSELSKMDTTVPHDMTYKEWKLEKAGRVQEKATLKLAEAQQNRREKVVALGEKTKELQEARASFHQATAIRDEKISPNRSKNKKVRTKEYKGE